jgi:hypothetical protein
MSMRRIRFWRERAVVYVEVWRRRDALWAIDLDLIAVGEAASTVD